MSKRNILSVKVFFVVTIMILSTFVLLNNNVAASDHDVESKFRWGNEYNYMEGGKVPDTVYPNGVYISDGWGAGAARYNFYTQNTFLDYVKITVKYTDYNTGGFGPGPHLRLLNYNTGNLDDLTGDWGAGTDLIKSYTLYYPDYDKYMDDLSNMRVSIDANGEDDTHIAWVELSWVPKNIEPVLTDGSVNPTWGYEYEDFQFRVHYSDENSDVPSTKWVILKRNGGSEQSYNMVAESGTGYDSYYSTTPPSLLPGNYQYYFYFTDGYGGDARLPASTGSYYTFTVAENQPPNTPSVPSGEINCRPTLDYQYNTVTTDIEGNKIYYYWNWGDGTNSGWIGPFNPGEECVIGNSWPNTGTYSVSVQAKDKYGKLSDISDSLSVTVYNNRPQTPTYINGPSSGTHNYWYGYSTSSSDPDGDEVRYRFYWDDGASSWTNLISSGDNAYKSHKWNSPGNYYIKVIAEDEFGLRSVSYSPEKRVSINNRNPEQPQQPSGPEIGRTGHSYNFLTKAFDTNNDNVKFWWDWEGSPPYDETGYYSSNENAIWSHIWDVTTESFFDIRVRAEDVYGGTSSWSDSYTFMVIPEKSDVPDLAVPYDDITFELNDGKVDISFKILNSGTKAYNIDYKLVDIDMKTGHEKTLKSGTIAELNEKDFIIYYTSATLKDPENHQIKITVDLPNDDIYEGEYGEGNNIAIKRISLIEGYILTSIYQNNELYHIMFFPKDGYAPSEVINSFINKEPQFITGIKELWIVNSNTPYLKIDNKNNIIGEILYNIVSQFYVGTPHYLNYGVFHSIDNAESICDNVRNRWLFDYLSLDHWFDEIWSAIKGEPEDMIALWEYTVMGPTSKLEPQSSVMSNILGATLATISIAGTLKGIKAKDGSTSFSKFCKLDNTGTYKAYQTFLKNTKIGKSITNKGDYFLELFDSISGQKIRLYILNKAFKLPEDATKDIEAFVKELNNNDYAKSLIDFYKTSAKGSLKKSFSLADYYDHLTSSEYAILNRLIVLKEMIDMYYPDSQLSKEFEAAIEKTKINLYSIEILQDPSSPDLFGDIIMPSIAEAAGRTFSETLIRLVAKKLLIKTFTALSSKLPFLASKGAATIASMATAVVAGVDIGLLMVNWDQVTKFADIAKMNTELGHYTLDTPTYALSSDINAYNEGFYSSILKSLKLLEIGSGYHNLAMSKEQIWYGLGGAAGWGETGRDYGNVCYEQSRLVEQEDYGGLFHLFNAMSSKYSIESFSDAEGLITVPSVKQYNTLNMHAKTTTKKMMHVGWLDGGLRWYCTGFDLKLDVIITKLNDTYIATLNPFEQTGSNRIEQIKNPERIRFKFYSSDGEVYDEYWHSWQRTNYLHDPSDIDMKTGRWHESPITVQLPWEPVSIDVEYGWYEDVANFFSGPRWMPYSGQFDLITFTQNHELKQTATDSGGSIAINPIFETGNTDNVTYFLSDSNNDTKNDTVTVNWNISKYENREKLYASAAIISGNYSGNASTQARYICGEFDTKYDSFNFTFSANITEKYDIYLYLFNITSAELLDDRLIEEIILANSSDNQPNNEKIYNLSYEYLDKNYDYKTDTINIEFNLNATPYNSPNCSVYIICQNQTGAIMNFNHTKYNLSNNPVKVQYSYTTLQEGDYEILIYLADEKQQLRDIERFNYYTGSNISTVFSDTFSDSAADTDGDGFYNTLKIDTSITLKSSGKYTIVATLENSSGIYLGSASVSDIFSQGLNYITFEFNSTMIKTSDRTDNFVLTALALLDENNTIIEKVSVNYQTSSYNLVSFEITDIIIYSTIKYNGVDTNNDGYFNYLQVDVPVEIYADGVYSFEGKISNNTNKFNNYAWNFSNLSIGNDIISLRFDGNSLRMNSVNTTFELDYIKIYNENGKLLAKTYLENEIGYWEYTLFQPFLTLSNDYSDAPLKHNADGKYKYLAVNTSCNVFQSGEYTLQCNLYGKNNKLIDHYQQRSVFSEGLHSISLVFNGTAIYKNHEITNYSLGELTIHYEGGQLVQKVDSLYTTSEYSFDIFAPPLVISCKCVNDEGIDIDANNYHDFLKMDFRINLSTPGYYMLFTELMDEKNNFISLASNLSYLSSGIHRIPLFFIGETIYEANISGFFNITAIQVLNEDGKVIYLEEISYQTNYYNSTEFESKSHPDFTVQNSDIYCSQTSPSEGELIYIFADIHNTGNLNASDTVVSFYKQNKTSQKLLFDDVVINHLNQSEAKNIEAIWEYHDGTKIYVEIDPQNYIKELNETNNTAVLIIDNTLPKINDATSGIASTGDSFTFSADVTDNLEISEVYLEYWYGSEVHKNESMDYYSNNFYRNITIEHTLSTLHYKILAKDIGSNWQSTAINDINIYDNDKPDINSEIATPQMQLIENAVNISAEVTDNIMLETINVVITGPPGFPSINTSMNKGLSYYYNRTYSVEGTYNYSIWTQDTSGNSNLSAFHQFEIHTDTTPPTTTKTVGDPSFGVYKTWITSHTPIMLNATDDFVGVENITFRTWHNSSWSSWIMYSAPFYLYAEGIHYVEYYSTDKVGNIEEVQNDTHMVDNLPPATAIAFGVPSHNDRTIEWVTSNTTVYINATDCPIGGVGVAELHYNYGQGWFTIPSNKTSFTLPNEGSYSIEWFAVDYFGHNESIKSTQVAVDDTPPISWHTPAIENKHPSPGSIIHLHAEDQGVWQVNGPLNLYYKLNGGRVHQGNRVYAPWLGSYVLEYWAVDALGNEGLHNTVKFRVTLDNTIIDTLYFVGPHEWNRTHWDIAPETLICFDLEKANVARIQYCIDNDTWVRFQGCFSVPDFGMHSLYFYGINPAGWHQPTARIVINVVNEVAPITTCDLYPPRPPKYTGWYTNAVTISLDAVDRVSGVSETYYRFNEGNWLEYTKAIVVATDGRYTLEYYSVDNAGNEEAIQSTSFKIDKTAPAVSFKQPTSGHLYLLGHEILPLGQTVIIGQATLAVDAIDDTSGIKQVEFYVDGELQDTLTEQPFELVWDEMAFFKHTIKAVAIDKAGNRAAVEQEIWIFNL